MVRRIHNKISAFIEENDLIQAGDELILGVSGGADSMMMLDYFFAYKEFYKISIKVAHIHHGLREAADLDAKLVEEVCKEKEIPFYQHNCNIKEIAQMQRISEEEAGRKERYNFFISLLSANGKIVTAHNMNDQAETMLMRFVRGTDIKGLAGISPKRDQIIRPLLCLTREEIEAYCKVQEVAFRHDETNFQPIYTRNKMRLNCIPYIKEAFNPNIISTLGQHSKVYKEEEDFMMQHTKACFDKCSTTQNGQVILNAEMMLTYHSYIQKRIFMMAIEALSGSKDITLKHLRSCEELLSMQIGKEVHLPYGLQVKKDYQGIIIGSSEKQEGYCYNLDKDELEIPTKGMKIQLVKMSKNEYIKKQRIYQKNENNYTKYIDYDRINNGLQIRTRQSDDFIELGKGRKKLKKLFIDDKVSKALRDSMPLLADGNEIVWVVGHRLNTRYYITDCTKQILEIKILKGHE